MLLVLYFSKLDTGCQPFPRMHCIFEPLYSVSRPGSNVAHLFSKCSAKSYTLARMHTKRKSACTHIQGAYITARKKRNKI